MAILAAVEFSLFIPIFTSGSCCMMRDRSSS